MKHPLPQTWDLESIFPGGSSSKVLEDFLGQLKEEITAFKQTIEQAVAPQDANQVDGIRSWVETMQSIQMKLREAGAFAGCLAAENQNDKKAVLLGGQIKSLSAQYASTLTYLDQLFLAIPDQAWTLIMQQEPFSAIEFPLTERRERAKEKLAPELEALINELSIDGYHGWSDSYNTLVSKFRMTVEQNGKQVDLSAGQAYNKLHTPNNEERTALMQQWESSWTDLEDYCADALNHLAGFRLKVYGKRGWESIHKEPLDINRMSEATLKVMWDVIDRNKDVFVEYLDRKAKLMGLEKLAWVDVEAPLANGAKEVNYDEGAKLIEENFRKFSPKMADFAVHAFENAWIEAEDRAGKRPGGFCTSLPLKQETRIFMTYSGTSNNVGTLAHELGHGYHQFVMNDMPAMAQRYAMNVAETASTFAEMIVSDALVQQAASKEERIALLEDKIGRSIAFFMNIHARFIFETNFYAEREKGYVSVERLNDLMVDAQKVAYKDSLASYHPHFWAAKLHFYSTGVPFYNFPYTFGYLFSAGIYARAVKEGIAFEDKYAALLRDTGSMSVEDLAQKHLGVDLTQADFWQSAVDMAVADVREFMELTAE
ncbi:M3 family oligoendopeptidase [Paenibacillus sp. N1-5-1-14]|uniref:M3 family oligoendopeptidase n=1 Tax=Paenibacillus radicibacter TaxID=2972488 RepID=UPI00215974EF|nr:M3 family oligoendopeptidase [Paenibacillus radicibacter]MCR8645320.1 M3 family oligoendopeptidase [Paenibacillus radicibacter]